MRKRKPHHPVPWTEADYQRLRELAGQMPAAKIGQAMGRSKNAIIGMAYRMKIYLPRLEREPVEPEKLSTEKFEPAAVFAPPERPTAIVLPLPERSGAGPAIAALSSIQCHWPIGDPAHGDFAFCSQPIGAHGETYCAEHQERAVNKAYSRLR